MIRIPRAYQGLRRGFRFTPGAGETFTMGKIDNSENYLDGIRRLSSAGA